jgi:hypothetical protein
MVMISLRGIPRSVAEWVLLIKIKLLILQILMLMLVASLLAIPRREVATNYSYNPINYERIFNYINFDNISYINIVT